jgi:hypothetical protein
LVTSTKPLKTDPVRAAFSRRFADRDIEIVGVKDADLLKVVQKYEPGWTPAGVEPIAEQPIGRKNGQRGAMTRMRMLESIIAKHDALAAQHPELKPIGLDAFNYVASAESYFARPNRGKASDIGTLMIRDVATGKVHQGETRATKVDRKFYDAAVAHENQVNPLGAKGALAKEGGFSLTIENHLAKDMVERKAAGEAVPFVDPNRPEAPFPAGNWHAHPEFAKQHEALSKKRGGLLMERKALMEEGFDRLVKQLP